MANGRKAVGARPIGTRPAWLEQARPRRRPAVGVTHLTYLVGGTVLGLLVPTIDLAPHVTSTDIRPVLFAIGGGIIALISVIVSLLFLVVQWASTTFSPRLSLFRDDPKVWRGFGYFVGMFAYCTVAALAIGDDPTVSLLVPLAALLMVVVALMIIRRLQLRAFRSIQLSAVLTDVDLRGRAIVDALNPEEFDAPDDASENAPDGVPDASDVPDAPGTRPSGRPVIWRSRPVVLQQVRLQPLVEAADAADAVIVFEVGVGSTIQEGATLATVVGDARGGVTDAAVLAAVVTGAERTFDQDPRFAFRLIVDIALRAQSAAINDQATTVQCLDTLEGLLRHLARRKLDVGEIRRPGGSLRVVLAVPRWSDYISESLDDLTLAAGGSPMVLVRIRALLVDLLHVVPERRTIPLARRLTLVEERLRQHFPLAWQHLIATDRGADHDQR